MNIYNYPEETRESEWGYIASVGIYPNAISMDPDNQVVNHGFMGWLNSMMSQALANMNTDPSESYAYVRLSPVLS